MGKIRGPNPCFRQTILPKNNEPNFRFRRLVEKWSGLARTLLRSRLDRNADFPEDVRGREIHRLCKGVNA
jgi:hypothetical protein